MVKGQPQQQPRQQALRTQFDLIPVKYAKFLPALLEKNLVQTKAPPQSLRNCQQGLELTSHVSSIKGHQVTMLNTATL